ncbi:MAG TPA: glutathione peroxidase [Candidatus Sumerlaeota bacterium]|nr:glutathione peroxidase [Candidatus Sumerlaeota bacterium]HOR27507.1 glutathione peroxidase [Candidatus Sumerlaeota bacterium]HPK02980.1 glutathione peroxidase [Candidatus Sumerlaeota bacterium]
MTDTIYSVPVEPMADDDPATTETLAPWQGKVLLLVNVASRCGYTPQYAGLEQLHRAYFDQGLRVLGFPCNDFGGQEPGTEAEIVEFCQTNYDVTFPLYGKLHAKGEEISPLFEYLTGDKSPHPGEVKWNFEKFLIGRDGRLVARYASAVTPDAPELIEAIEAELAKPAP